MKQYLTVAYRPAKMVPVLVGNTNSNSTTTALPALINGKRRGSVSMGMGMSMSPQQMVEKLRKEKETLDKRLELTKRCIGLLSDIPTIVNQGHSAAEFCSIVLVKISAVQLLQLNASLQEGEEQAKLIDAYLEKHGSIITRPEFIPPQATHGVKR